MDLVLLADSLWDSADKLVGLLIVAISVLGGIGNAIVGKINERKKQAELEKHENHLRPSFPELVEPGRPAASSVPKQTMRLKEPSRPAVQPYPGPVATPFPDLLRPSPREPEQKPPQRKPGPPRARPVVHRGSKPHPSQTGRLATSPAGEQGRTTSKRSRPSKEQPEQGKRLLVDTPLVVEGEVLEPLLDVGQIRHPDRAALRRAIIMNEILSLPVALRPPQERF